ncbi:MAG TPA: hypothetical protein VGG69_03165 [Rhizomicrobium sp.]
MEQKSGTEVPAKWSERVRTALEVRSFAIADARFERGQRWIGPSGHMLEFTQEGNLELRGPTAQLLWQSKTSAGNAAALILKMNGELVIVDWRGYPLWSTGTAGNEGAFLALQRDGNLVLYSAEMTALWETGTAVA